MITKKNLCPTVSFAGDGLFFFASAQYFLKSQDDPWHGSPSSIFRICKDILTTIPYQSASFESEQKCKKCPKFFMIIRMGVEVCQEVRQRNAMPLASCWRRQLSMIKNDTDQHCCRLMRAWCDADIWRWQTTKKLLCWLVKKIDWNSLCFVKSASHLGQHEVAQTAGSSSENQHFWPDHDEAVN